MPDASPWLRKRIEEAESKQEYVPGESLANIAKRLGMNIEDVVKLDANENFLFPKDFLVSTLCHLSSLLDPRLYPLDEKEQLASTLAKYLGVCEDKIVLGNSSDELLEVAVRAFMKGRETAISISPTFVMYRIITSNMGHGFKEVSLAENYGLKVNHLLDACDDSTVLCFLCSPNNPTGNQFPTDQIRAFAQSFQGLIIVDEAYVEFAPLSIVRLTEEFGNLIVTRTFSKAFGLAGLRIGYAVASPQVTSALKKMQLPYNINTVSLGMATEVLKNPDVVAEIVQAVKAERAYLYEALNGIHNVIAYPSDTNFILFRTSKSSIEVAKALEDRGVLVRSYSDAPMLKGCLRVTVGNREMNDRFLFILEAVLNG